MPRLTARWRQFETLVSAIERSLAPVGATVKSPDRIVDKDGTSREIDASIRYRLGSADVLVIVECRRRGAKQDKRWMEELWSKRESVGAALVIAVSSSGFSRPTRQAAGRLGIQLRVMRDVTSEEISSWCLVESGEVRERKFELISCHVKLRKDVEDESAAAAIMKERTQDVGFVRGRDGLALPLCRWAELALAQNAARFEPYSEQKKRATTVIRFDGVLWAVHGECRAQVEAMEVCFDSWEELRHCPRTSAVAYGPVEGGGYQYVEFPMVIDGRECALMFTRDVATGITRIGFGSRELDEIQGADRRSRSDGRKSS